MNNSLVPDSDNRPWDTVTVRGQQVLYHHLDDEELDQALATLPAKQRMACFWAADGLSTKDIAEKVNLEVTSLRTYIGQSPVFKDCLYTCASTKHRFTTDLVRQMAQHDAPEVLDRIRAIAEQEITADTPASKQSVVLDANKELFRVADVYPKGQEAGAINIGQIFIKVDQNLKEHKPAWED